MFAFPFGNGEFGAALRIVIAVGIIFLDFIGKRGGITVINLPGLGDPISPYDEETEYGQRNQSNPKRFNLPT